MEVLSGILAIASIVWLIFGLIKPTKAAPFLKKPTRLKVFGMALLLFFAAGVIAPKESAPQTTSEKADTTQQAKKIYTMGELYNAKNFEIAVLDKQVTDRVSDSSGYLFTKADGSFVVLTIQYKNIAKEAMRLDNSAFRLKLGDATYSPVTLTININENIFLDLINPGIQKTGKIYFDVPKDIANSDDFILQLSRSFVSDNSSGQILLKNNQ